MLLSKDWRFIFVHIQKSGGTSITEALKNKAPDARPLLGTHAHAKWARARFGRKWDDFFTFAFVRNPWDRLVSWWTMIEKWGPSSLENDPNSDQLKFLRYVLGRADDFEGFVRHCTDVVADHDGYKCIAYDQADYVCDDDGAVMVDFVGRFERLQRDMDAVADRLRLGRVRLPHVNASKHAHYSTYYSDDLRDLVAARHARDIEMFGYEFEDRR